MKSKLIFLLLSAAIFWSCGNHTADKTTITFWAIGAEGEQVSKLIPEFERQNPGIKVRVQQIPWTAAHEKLITAFASETLPDVFQVGNTWVPEFEALGTVEPLDDYLIKSGVIRDTSFFEGILGTNEIDGKIYGIPWYVDTRVLFYRTDVIEKAGYSSPPKTWDELYDLSKKIKAQNPGNYAFFLPTNEWLPFILFGIQNGSALLKNNDSYGDFSGKPFREAFEYLAKYYYDGLAPKDMQAVMNIYQAFTEAYFSMVITGPWNVTEMKNRLPAQMQNKWMTAPLPSPDSVYPGYSLAGGSSIVINKNSGKKNLAWKFIEFLSSHEIQYKFYNQVSALPSVKSVWDEPALKNDKYMQAFYVQLNRTKATPKIPEWEQIVFAKIQQYAEFVAAKKLTVEEALKELDSDTDKILEKRRWILEKEGKL